MEYKLVPVEPIAEIVSAMMTSRAVDAEGAFSPLMDLIDFSGENKTRTVVRAAYAAAIAAAPSPEWIPVSERLPTLEGKYIVLTTGNEGWQTRWFRPADRWELETKLNRVTHWLDFQPPAPPIEAAVSRQRADHTPQGPAGEPGDT